MDNTKKLGFWTLIMLIFVPTFGFNNITSNAVALGPAAIPSWLIVSLLFFLPLSIMFAELASASQDKGGGIYSWIECSLGAKWAFIGTWSYFISNLFFLQMVFARLPVMISWTIFGENRFNDANAYMLPWIGLVIAILLTFIATSGVKQFSKISDVGGQLTLIATVLFVVFAIVGFLIGKTPSATTLSAATVIPKFDASYFSTFSWLLLSVAGAEVAGTYIRDVDKPEKIFPKGVIIATILIGLAYILGSLAVCLITSPAALDHAGIKDANYIVYQILGNNWGLNGKIVVRIYAFINTIASVGAYVVWMESPLRAMFSEVPPGTFPRFLTKQRADGTMVNALWAQCAILFIMILVPLVGLHSIDKFFILITNLSSLSLVVPYIVLGAAYLVFRLKNKKPQFLMIKSNTMVFFASGIVIALGVAGFFGAGWGDIAGAATVTDALVPIAKDYGGPIILILFGLLITWLTKKFEAKE